MMAPHQDFDSGAIIRLLGLTPHPEGGCYRKTFRDSAMTDGCSALTAIYFLLCAGEISRWKRAFGTTLLNSGTGTPAPRWHFRSRPLDRQPR